MSHSSDQNFMTYLSPRIRSQLPRFVRDYGQNLIAFLTAYYEWMERNYGPQVVHSYTESWDDIDTTLNEFVNYFHNEFMISIPESVLCDRRLLLKHIREFYRSRGSPRSYELLFRILFNESVEFYYPGRDILRASDGKWVIEKSVRIRSSKTLQQLNAYLGHLVRSGNDPLVRGRVESIKQVVIDDVEMTDIYLSSLRGQFEPEDDVLDTVDGDVIGKVISQTIHPGYWKNEDGFLSSSIKRLQDRDYYQEYSYVLKTGVSLEQYIRPVRELLHPAGTKLFGEMAHQVETDVLIPEIDFHWIDMSYAAVTANMAPVVETGVGFVEPGDSLLSYELLANHHVLFSATTEYYQITDTIGNVDVAQSQIIGSYPGPIYKYAAWSSEHIQNRRCLLGTGTLFEIDFVSNTRILIHDQTNTYEDTVYDIQVIGSNTTMLLTTGYRYSPPVSNATIAIYRSV